MKKYYLLGMTLFFTIIAFCQVPEWQWANSAGGTLQAVGNSIVHDSEGNLYVTGYFEGSVNFGVTYLTSSGNMDIFVAKMDSDGNWIWARKAGGVVGNDVGYSITIDNSGNIYVSGHCYGEVNFGSINLMCNYQDAFIAKIDNNGNWQWVKHTDSTDQDIAYSIVVDGLGNQYITGYFNGTLTFGLDVINCVGAVDIFIAKIDSQGNWLWGKRAGGLLNEHSFSLAIDSANNLYVTGYFEGSADFGSTNLVSSGLRDVFVGKLDTNGNWIWAKKAGGTLDDLSFSITIDNIGNSYITGFFSGTSDFGSITETSYGGNDIFISKLNPNGNWLWVEKAGGTTNDEGRSIEVDSSGDIYFTGYFTDIALFGPFSLISTNYTSPDILVSKLDTNGNWLWVEKAGGTGDDRGLSICIYESNIQYITGYFAGIALFGQHAIASSGSTGMFITKLGLTPISNEDPFSYNVSSNLQNNYPNPFRDETKISYQVKESDRVMIKIYNTKGQLINTLLNETKTSGVHDIIWRGNDSQGRKVPAGIYLYQVNIGPTKFIKKAVVLR